MQVLPSIALPAAATDDSDDTDSTGSDAEPNIILSGWAQETSGEVSGAPVRGSWHLAPDARAKHAGLRVLYRSWRAPSARPQHSNLSPHQRDSQPHPAPATQPLRLQFRDPYAHLLHQLSLHQLQ